MPSTPMPSTPMVLSLWLSGDWSRAGELRQALAGHPGVRLAAAPGSAAAVVHVGGDELHDELLAASERVDVPTVFLARAGARELLEAALDAGAADVLILPQPAEAVVFAAQRAVAAAARRRAEDSQARVVTVLSPKGGTGKTTVSSNLAVALAGRGQRVLLVDLDLQFGDVAIVLGLQPTRTLYDLLTAPGSLDAEKIAGYATPYLDVDVLAGPLRPEDADSISDERVGDLLDAARGGYDVIVVDTAPFFQGAVLTALDRTDELLVVCAPDVPTMKNVRLAFQTLDLLSFDPARVRLVVNRVSERVGFRAAQVASALERRVDFELPEDESVGIAVNRGEPVVRFRPQSPFSLALAGVAVEVGGEVSVPARHWSRRLLALGRHS